MRLLFTFCFSLFFVLGMNAQTTDQEFDAQQEQLEQRIKQLENMLSQSMREFDSRMERLEENSDPIIINGDTIIVAPGGILPPGFEDLAEDLHRLDMQGDNPMEDLQLFFGGDMPTQMFDMLQEMQGNMPEMMSEFEKFFGQMPGLEGMPPSEERKDGEAPSKKSKDKKKTYSL